MAPHLLAGITADQTIAISGLASVIIALALALNSWLKDRGEKGERARREEREDDRRYQDLQSMVETKFSEVRDQVEHLTVSLVGRDAHHGLPAVDGFVQRQERHNRHVDEELRTSNGGGTVKGSLARLRVDVTSLQSMVAQLVNQEPKS